MSSPKLPDLDLMKLYKSGDEDIYKLNNCIIIKVPDDEKSNSSDPDYQLHFLSDGESDDTEHYPPTSECKSTNLDPRLNRSSEQKAKLKNLRKSASFPSLLDQSKRFEKGASTSLLPVPTYMSSLNNINNDPFQLEQWKSGTNYKSYENYSKHNKMSRNFSDPEVNFFNRNPELPPGRHAYGDVYRDKSMTHNFNDPEFSSLQGNYYDNKEPRRQVYSRPTYAQDHSHASRTFTQSDYNWEQIEQNVADNANNGFTQGLSHRRQRCSRMRSRFIRPYGNRGNSSSNMNNFNFQDDDTKFGAINRRHHMGNEQNVINSFGQGQNKRFPHRPIFRRK